MRCQISAASRSSRGKQSSQADSNMEDHARHQTLLPDCEDTEQHSQEANRELHWRRKDQVSESINESLQDDRGKRAASQSFELLEQIPTIHQLLTETRCKRKPDPQHSFEWRVWEHCLHAAELLHIRPKYRC